MRDRGGVTIGDVPIHRRHDPAAIDANAYVRRAGPRKRRGVERRVRFHDMALRMTEAKQRGEEEREDHCGFSRAGQLISRCTGGSREGSSSWTRKRDPSGEGSKSIAFAAWKSM